jgi:hypothetical protein
MAGAMVSDRNARIAPRGEKLVCSTTVSVGVGRETKQGHAWTFWA